jgi:hypothetical protein
MTEYKNRGLYHPETIDARLKACLEAYDSRNLLPADFAEILKKEMERLL